MNAITAIMRSTGEDAPDISPLLDANVSSALEQGAVVVFSLSGGKDSTCVADVVMRHLDALGHPRSDRYAIHADLGRAEWRSTPATVEAQAAALGLPLIIVKRRQGDMVDMWRQRFDDGIPPYQRLELVIHRGPWSSSSQRFCTAGQKRDQIVQEIARRFPGRTVISVIGVRRAESVGRRSTPVSSWEKKLKRADGTRGLNWNAIADASTPDVVSHVMASGLPIHEAYTTYGATRLSCALCVLSSAHDVAAALSCADNHPLFHELVLIEAETGFSFQQKKWLADMRPDLVLPEVAPRIASAQAYAADRRAAEGAIGKGFLEGSSEDPWPRRLPTESEAVAIAEARRIVQSWTGKEMPYRTAASVIDRVAALHATRVRPSGAK